MRHLFVIQNELQQEIFIASVENDRDHKETEREVHIEGQRVRCKGHSGGMRFHYLPHTYKMCSQWVISLSLSHMVAARVLATSLMRLPSLTTGRNPGTAIIAHFRCAADRPYLSYVLADGAHA